MAQTLKDYVVSHKWIFKNPVKFSKQIADYYAKLHGIVLYYITVLLQKKNNVEIGSTYVLR